MYRFQFFRITWLRSALIFLFGLSLITLLTVNYIHLDQHHSIKRSTKCIEDLLAVNTSPTSSVEITKYDEDDLIMIESSIESLTTNFSDTSAKSPIPIIYVVTPTYPRMEQMAELTNFGQTLMLIKNVHWLVIEDADNQTVEVENLLDRFTFPHTYLLTRMPMKYQKLKKPKPRGVANRLAGVEWIKKYGNDNGVMYFADDDNTYDIRLFEEMRWTKKVSMWPVGLVTNLGVSTPVVKDGHVIGFYDGWIAKRTFPVDMAGFAVNVAFLKSAKDATMPFRAGYQEDGFLKSLKITMDDIEPKACDCTISLTSETDGSKKFLHGVYTEQYATLYTVDNPTKLWIEKK